MVLITLTGLVTFHDTLYDLGNGQKVYLVNDIQTANWACEFIGPNVAKGAKVIYTSSQGKNGLNSIIFYLKEDDFF